MPHVNRAILFPLAWPLGITAPQTHRPWATYFLLALNAALLALLCFNPALAGRLAMAPAAPPSWQYLTYAFTHGSLLAGFIDLLFIWTFAPALENRLGPFFLLLFYLLTGAAGAAAHSLFPGTGTAPLSGAAAVVCALMGATIVLFPRDSVRLFVGLALLLKPLFARELRIPVFICALAYVGLEFGLAHLAQATQLSYVLEHSGFSIPLHLGGLFAGALLAGIFNRQPAAPRPQRKASRRAAAAAGQDATPQAPPEPSLEADLAFFGPQTPAGEPLLALATSQPEEFDLFSAASDSANARPQPAAANPNIALFGDPEASSFGALIPALAPSARKTPKKETSAERKAPPPDDLPISFDLDDTDGNGELKTVQNAAMPVPPSPAAAATPPPSSDETALSTVLSPEPVELQLEPSEETQAQARALKDDTAWPDVNAGRFAVILPPGRPPQIASIVTLLADSLGLSLKGAYQILQHRHGILADNVSREEAERLAGRFAKAGHAVLVVALTKRIQFGGGLDLISIQEHQNHVLFTTVAQMIRGEWDQIVFLAAGQVVIAAGTPPRTVLDIFMVKPRHHLRLWDNSFSYSKEMPKFRAQALRITELATKAIHTRSLDKWLRHETEPLHQFKSMIEYEHYVRWHLMAHLAPGKLVK